MFELVQFVELRGEELSVFQVGEPNPETDGEIDGVVSSDYGQTLFLNGCLVQQPFPM